MDETWQRDCEQAADHNIRSHLEHERRQLARRLYEDALGMRCPGPTGQQADPLRRYLADLMISGTQYLAQHMTSNVARAEDLADDLLRLHYQLVPSEVCQALDEAGGDLQLRVEQIAQQHGPQIRRTLDQQRVLGLLKQEDDRLLQVLITLHCRLQTWVPFDDHETSERDGVAESHTKAERMLAAALCDVLQALQDDTQPEQPGCVAPGKHMATGQHRI